VDVVGRASKLLSSHPSVRSVRLVGSRAEGRATELSDFDLLVETDDFDRLRADLPRLLEPLAPLAAQWDRLSEEGACYMLMLPGAVKLDLIFARPPRLEPPWEARADTLEGIDRHFWDWILWLGGKQLSGKHELVRAHLGGLMFEHLLRPVGVADRPGSISEALDGYLEARAKREREFGTRVPTELGDAVRARLHSTGLV
jgi:Nucleotidyltransferase domain